MSLLPSPVTRVLACAALYAATLSAQQVRVAAPVGVLGGGDPAAQAGDDPGTRVEMFENPNLDRYLRRAQSFLGRQDFSAAIEVLQDVIEGRTVEVVAVRPEEDGEGGPAQPTEKPDGQRNEGEPKEGERPANTSLDARNAVFSHDGRLYRPVRRLCHELLSRMPDVGIDIYRTTHEFAAEEMLAEAMREGSSQALERVANRYFITLPAGRAMMLLADRLMHEGRYRAAVQVLRDLLEIYPAQNRSQLGIRDVWCEFKIALCLRLAGEGEAAQGAVQSLANEHSEESLRILGQLESIKDLPSSQVFARDVIAIEAAPVRGAGIRWLTPETEELTALWQYRFANPDPYKDPKPSNTRNSGGFFIGQGNRPTTMPFANRYGPGTWLAFGHERDGEFAVPRAVFLEHYRLRLADAATGLMLREGDGQLDPPIARENHPRVRIAAVDQALLRPVEDESRRYVVVGHQGNTTTSQVSLKNTQLIAYEKEAKQDGTFARAWSSEDWPDGEDGLRDVTFLAAPTVFGEKLLLPSIRRDAYTLECVDRATGKPLWHTALHAGGTPYFKAPGCPVEVRGGVAFVATNAGCVAAVDAFAGDLRWIRRYERRDSIHKRPRKKSVSPNARFRNYNTTFAQAALDSFVPSDLTFHEGLLVIAPCDSELLMAIDAASGEPVWMLDGRTRYAPYGQLTEVVGSNDEHLFAMSDSHLVCIELDGGLVRWAQKLPSWSGPKYSGRGRGVVLDSVVVVPNMRELLLFDTENERPMRRLRLPDYGAGREPLQGSCHVVVDGPWLGVGYAGGVEVYSTADALGQLAEVTDDPLRRAHYLTLSGDGAAAERVLAETIRGSDDKALRTRAGNRLLALVDERARRIARDDGLAPALAAMDEVYELLAAREVRLDWFLARVEICKEAGDLRAHETAQERLYAYMEGRG